MTTTNTEQFVSTFVQELTGASAASAITFPASLFLFFSVFAVDPLLGDQQAKAMYLVGYVLLLAYFYSFGSMVFPAARPSVNTIPFEGITSMSFFCVFIGFTLSYWLTLNASLHTQGVGKLALCYATVMILSMFYYLLALRGEWQSMVASAWLGVSVGIVYGFLTSGTMTDKKKTKDSSVDGDSCSRSQRDEYENTGNNQNEDMICRVSSGKTI